MRGQKKKTPEMPEVLKKWAVRGSNSRPSGCKPDALPAELTTHQFMRLLYHFSKVVSSMLSVCISMYQYVYRS